MVAARCSRRPIILLPRRPEITEVVANAARLWRQVLSSLPGFQHRSCASFVRLSRHIARPTSRSSASIGGAGANPPTRGRTWTGYDVSRGSWPSVDTPHGLPIPVSVCFRKDSSKAPGSSLRREVSQSARLASSHAAARCRPQRPRSRITSHMHEPMLTVSNGTDRPPCDHSAMCPRRCPLSEHTSTNPRQQRQSGPAS